MTSLHWYPIQPETAGAVRELRMGELNRKPEGHGLNLSPAAVGVLIAEDFPLYRQYVCSTLAKGPTSMIGLCQEGKSSPDALRRSAGVSPF